MAKKKVCTVQQTADLLVIVHETVVGKNNNIQDGGFSGRVHGRAVGRVNKVSQNFTFLSSCDILLHR